MTFQPDTADLHDVILRVHKLHPCGLSANLLEHSTRVQDACARFATETSVEIGHYNRLKYMIYLFQLKKGEDCKCGLVGTECGMFLFRSFLACGGYAYLTQVLLSDPSNSMWMVLGSSTLQQTVHRWCLHLLFVLSLAPVQTFQRCLGGSGFQMTIVSHMIARTGLKQETEYTLCIESCLGSNKTIRKKLPLLVTFLEQMQAALRGVIELPVLPTHKGSIQEVAELVKTSANTVFEFLCVPAQFYRMYRVEAARSLVCAFVDLDIKPSQPMLTHLSQCISDYVLPYKDAYVQKRRRNLSGLEFQYLVRILTGASLSVTPELISEPELIVHEQVDFPITVLKETWILPQILAVLPTIPDDCATLFLRELNQFFTQQPQTRTKLMADEPFVSWFFPALFDHTLEDNAETSEMPESDRRLTVFGLCIDIIGGGLVHEITTKIRKREEPKTAADIKATAEGMFASALVQIGTCDVGRTPWCRRNVEVFQALANNVARKLVAVAPTFRSSWKHPAWANVMEVLNVYRNMAWCCLTPGSSSSETSDMPVIRSLLQTSTKLAPPETVKILLSEAVVSSLRECCRSFNLFDLGNIDDVPEDKKRVEALKGSGVAFLSFFRDCFSCVRTQKTLAPENQLKMMLMFVSTHVFKRAYSKEEEDRLSMIHDTEIRRRTSVVARTKGAYDENKQIIRDLETLAAGVTLWQIPKRGNVQQCFLYLKSQATGAQGMGTSKTLNFTKSSNFTLVLEAGKDKTSFTLFEQATLELGVNDPKLLAKSDVEYAKELGLNMWKDKECRQFVCISLQDYQCCSRVLRFLRAQRIETTASSPSLSSTMIAEEKSLDYSELVFPMDASKITLHQFIMMIHQFFPSEINASMLNYSQKIASTTSSRDLGDLNRLRFLVHLIEGDCIQIALPCRNCSKAEKTHDENSLCVGYFSFIECFCCKSPLHQGVNSTECLCEVDAKDSCVMLTIKTFLAHGGRELLQGMLRDGSRAWYIHRWCFHLLWLLSNLNPVQFDKCWGGTRANVNIESHSTVRVGLKSETDFVFVVDLPLQRKKVTKKMVDVIAFQEQLTLSLKGTVDLTGLSKPKGVSTEVPATLQASMNTIFQFFAVPANFQILARVVKAKELFCEFLEIPVNSLKLSRIIFTQILCDFTPLYRENRNMSGSIVKLLLRLMTGEHMTPFIDIIDDPQFIPREDISNFGVTKISEIWLLSHILRALPVVSDEVAVLVLREFNHFFLRQTSVVKDVLCLSDYVQWFFPIFFDRYSNENKQAVSVRSSWDCYYLSVNFLCVIQSTRILSTTPLESKAGEPDSCEGMIASTAAQIGAFDGQSIGLQLTPWSKANVDIVQAVLAGVVGKLGAAVSSFRSVIDHPAWRNVMDVLNVYRNMTWCSVLSSSMVRLLLLQGAPTSRAPGEPFRVLLSEQILLNVRSLLQNLHVFEIVADAVDEQENVKINMIKGSALYYWGYFRECLSCLQTAKDYSLEDQEKMMSLFLQTYPFDLNYSKEEETRVALLEQNEVRRKRSAARTLEGGTQQDEKQQQRGFQLCGGGVFAWKIPTKKGGKVEGCFLFLRQEEEKIWRGGGVKYVVTLQTPHKKESLPLFEKITVVPDPNSPKNGVEFIQHEGFVLTQGNERTDLVCISASECNVWCDMLNELQDRRLQKEPSQIKLDLSNKSARPSLTPESPSREDDSVSEDKSPAVDLHAAFVLVHEVFGNSVSASLLEFSNKVDSVCPKHSDLALFNRLRFLVNVFQVGCDQFSPPCRTCGKAEKVHGNGYQCAKYLASEDSGVCVCGKTEGAHPWAVSSPRECRCGSKDLCPLFIMKAFVASGGKECLQRILCDVSRPSYLHHWCLHLLWLWCQVPPTSFDRCWGGTRVTVSVNSHTSVRAGIKTETEFLLAVEAVGRASIIRKKMGSLLSFHEALRDSLKGVLDLPSVAGAKGNATEVAEEVKTSMGAVFQMLNVAENFYKLLKVDKAKSIFFEFLENDLQSLQENKTAFTQYVSQFTLSHREDYSRKQTRSIATSSFQYLVYLLTGTALIGSTEIISDAKNISRDITPAAMMNTTTITKLAEPWLLSYMLPSLVAANTEQVVGFLKELNDFFKLQPLVRSCLLVEDTLLVWLLPVLFDFDESDEKKTSNSNEEGASRKEIMDLAIDLVSSGIKYEITTRRSVKKMEMKGFDQLKTTAEGLFATAIVQIGTFSEARDPIWSGQHISVIQALSLDLADQLTAEITGLHSTLQHPAWGNVLEVLSVFYHMTNCVVIPTPIANESQDVQVARILLGTATNVPKNVGPEAWRVLLSEHILSAVCRLLSMMNLFELVAADKSSEEANRLKMVKGAGLAFTEYFRGCLSCFRTVRGSSSDERAKVIAQFVATFVINKAYSKETESRLKALADSDSARKSRTVVGAVDSNTLLCDLDVLGAGVSVWLLPKKGKMQQFYLYLKRDEVKAGKAPSYHLILELQTTRKKNKFSIPKEASLELGTHDPNLLTSHGLSAANSAGLILTQGKTKTDLVCTSWDDYGSWQRVLPALSSNSLPTEGLRVVSASGVAGSVTPIPIPPSTPKAEHTPIPPSTPKGEHGRSFSTPVPEVSAVPPRVALPSSPTNRIQSFIHVAPTEATTPVIAGPAPPPRRVPPPPSTDLPSPEANQSSVPPLPRSPSFVNTAPSTPINQSPRNSPESTTRSFVPPPMQRAQSFVNVAPTSPSPPPRVGSPAHNRAQSFVNIAPTSPDMRPQVNSPASPRTRTLPADPNLQVGAKPRPPPRSKPAEPNP